MFLTSNKPLKPDPVVEFYNVRPPLERNLVNLRSRCEDYPTPYDWILLTHVCRAWRQLALSTSSLWTHVAIVGDSWEPTTELLGRAGDRLLTLTCSADRAYDSDRLKYLFPYCIRQVATVVLPTTAATLITPFLAQEAVHLETMTLVGPSVTTHYLATEIAQFDTPYNFPALKHIKTVSPLPGPITRLFSSTLTSLILRYPREDDDLFEEPPWSYRSHLLAAALVHTPHLEFLSVDLYDFTELVTSTPALPNLRQLSIRGEAIPCVEFYRVLQIPCNTRLEIDCLPLTTDPYFSSIEEWEAPEAIIAAAKYQPLIVRSRFEPIAAFSIRASGSIYYFDGWRSPLVASDLDAQQPDVVVNIPTLCSYANVLTLMSAIPLPCPQILRLQTYPFGLGAGGSAKVALSLAALPSLKTIILRNAPPHAACRIVAVTSASEVRLHGVDFSNMPKSHATDHLRRCMALLIQCVVIRTNGCPRPQERWDVARIHHLLRESRAVPRAAQHSERERFI